MRRLAVLLLLATLHCNDNDPATTEGGSGGDGAAASSSGTAGNGSGAGSAGGGGEGVGAGGPTGEWQALITGDWTLEPFSEDTNDTHTLVLDRDIYVGAIRPLAPQGTHHTVLMLDGASSARTIYASGVGTNALVFPLGVGLKLEQGQLLALQLHTFNPAGEALSGTSGIEIIEVPAEEVVNEAEVFLPGPIGLNIGPNQMTTETGTCTLSQPQTLFALFPHMHQLGVHFKTTLTIGGESQVLHDGAYDFEHQAFIPFDPIAMGPGDSVTTECTWNNTTSSQVTWGESSTSEMCFSILYRYPALGGGLGFCN